MAIRSGACTLCAGWTATLPCRRPPATVDRSRRLVQPPCLSTTFPPVQMQRMWALHAAAAIQVEAGDEVLLESPGHFRIYKSGKMDRLNDPTVMPAGLDEATGVTSRDVVLDADTRVSVRLYLPKLPGNQSSTKLPVLVYFHGGAFLIGSADDAAYHGYVNALAAAAGALVVSADYRLAPEHPLPAAYDDCWAALRWAAAPSTQDEWISEHGDTSRLFLAGDSAGANIVHEMLARAAASDDGPRMEGAILLHPWFSGSEAIEGELAAVPVFNGMIWSYTCPGAVGGADDPRINPLAPGAPSLETLPCERMLVCAAEKDVLATRIRAYHQTVAAGACRAAWFESEGEDHDFFLGKPDCESAKQLLDRVVAFIAEG
ncbi:2-hydroxyisoflavanone dehydratase [Lolium perenne]|uniref:2-hydroxyisoflavanone dehydratase n=1 Tax=Lolium perenne TaxID=4522 RepID=UPI0021F670F2|nr:2-hydroxyisoflavanone dehydratase-like [Lolium perenne]XP_051188116.1 2-hydroxyisoflavanone dehydratase-like [Lolium perenne]